MPVSRRTAVAALGTAAAGIALRGSSLFGADRPIPRNAPNILVIMTDDQRFDALSATGNTILRTPNIDRIANEGVRFTQAFVTNSLCAPSRASLLTGLYSHVHGVVTHGTVPENRNQPGLRDEQETFVTILQRAGWHTGLVGKWHIRSEPKGFDRWVILPGGGGPYMDPTMTANAVPLKFRGHADDITGDQALAFLESRPVDRPFCLLYNFKAPHRNWIPPARFADAFADLEVPVPRTFEDKLEGRPEALRRAQMAIAEMKDFRNRGVPADLPPEERKRRNLEELVKNYYRTLLGVDENVGRVLDWLDAKELARDTVVIFTSDNGFFLGEHGLYDKRLMYEPSIRVPLLVRHPARFAPRVDAQHMVLNIDLAPTILALAGIPAPDAMQGRSAVPLLAGEDVPWRDDFLYEFFEYPDADHCVMKHRGLRTKKWKLIHFFEQPEGWELYDLETDPDEMTNLAGIRKYAAVERQLRARLAEVRKELGDSDPPGPAPVAPPCAGGGARG
ncbi:MAG TPA: sulfatase [Thermoanaerobaculia bacterium]|nr:sulfatase [Thermoanaerobaculia bacterium]